MTAPSDRRAFLRGTLTAAGAVSIAVPAAATVSIASPYHPDAALLAMQPEIDAADQAWAAAAAVRDRVERIYRDATPEQPRRQPSKVSVSQLVDMRHSAAAIAALEVVFERENRDYKIAVEAWREDCDRLGDECGFTAAEAAQDAADDAQIEIRDRIAETRARTLDGLIFKARFAAAHYPGDPDRRVMPSIIDDLLALAGKEA